MDNIKLLKSSGQYFYPVTHEKAVLMLSGKTLEQELAEDYISDHQPIKTINGNSLIGEGDVAIIAEKGDLGEPGVSYTTPVTIYQELGLNTNGTMSQKAINDAIDSVNTVIEDTGLNGTIEVYSVPQQDDFYTTNTYYYAYDGSIDDFTGNKYTIVFKTGYRYAGDFVLMSNYRIIECDGVAANYTLINASQYTAKTPFTKKYIAISGPTANIYANYGNNRSFFYFVDNLRNYDYLKRQQLDDSLCRYELGLAANNTTNTNLDSDSALKTFPKNTNLIYKYGNNTVKSYNSLSNASVFPYPTIAFRLNTCLNLYAFCPRIKQIDISYFDTSSVNNFNGMFAFCSMLEKVNLIGIDFTKASAFSNMFIYDEKLTSLIGDHTLEEVLNGLSIFDGVSVTVSPVLPVSLERASLRAIINGLADLTGQTSKLLLLHGDLINKLTAEDRAVLTGKNWTLIRINYK